MNHWYMDGNVFVVVQTGMPEHHVEIGLGATPATALEDLSITAMQSTGRDGGLSAALEWAENAGWIISADALEEIDDPETDEVAEGE